MTAPGLDLVDGRLPLPLGGGVVTSVLPSDIDVQIENLAFWLKIDKQAPYQRQTAPYKKEQTDVQPEAGEASLATWWLRSQMSFHYGAGQRYLDTDAQHDPVTRARFRDCRGVDVWTPGVVSRLNGTALADATADTAQAWVKTTLVSGVETLISAHGTTVRTYNGTTWTALPQTSTFPILGFCIDGTNYYTLTTDGVWKQPISGGTQVKLYTLANVTSGALGWAKDRLMAAVNNIIYQLDCNAAAARTVTDGATNATTTVTSATAAFTNRDQGAAITGGSIPAGATISSVTNATTVVLSAAATATATGVTLTITQAPAALPTMTYTHPNAAWRFTCFCETPVGIGVAGSAGLLSTVMEMKLEMVNGAPVLDSAIRLLTTPPGEIIADAYLHLGSQLVLATNRGVRVSTFQSYFGTITLGPNVNLAGDGVQLPCTSLAAYDRFIFAGTRFDGQPALMRVDLSSIEDQQGHYPWAPDLLLPAGAPAQSGTVASIVVRQDGTKWFAVTGYGTVSEQSSPDSAQPAWLQTSRIRLGSVEDKHWVHGVVRGTLSSSAPITVETMGPSDSAWTTAYTAQVNADPFGLNEAKGEWLQLRFTLALGAQLNSYQVQALPAGKRQRILQLPLWVEDYQVTRSGVGVGYDGWALERLAALEEIEQGGGVVTLSAPALFSESVRGVIEQITYVQDQDPGDRGLGTGGVVVIQFRTTQ